MLPLSMADNRGAVARNTQRWSADLRAHCAAKYAEVSTTTSNNSLLEDLNRQVPEECLDPHNCTPQWTWDVTIQA